MAKPTDKDVVRGIGVAALADALGKTRFAVKKWMQRGIPWQYRAKVAKLATRQQVKVPADFLERRAA